MPRTKKTIEKVGDKELYIKSTRPYNELDGDFTVMQTRTLVRLAEEMNPRIENQLATRDSSGKMGLLFSEEEFKDGIVHMTIPISTFGVKPKDYPDIKKACEDLANTKVYENYIDENGTTHWKTINVFHSIDYTTDINGKRNVNFEIVRTMAERIFTLSHGFSEYSKRIISLSRNSRAIRMYIRLSNARNNGFEKIPYTELKRFFGTIETAPNDPDKVIKDKYERYSHFKRHILEPVRAELDKLVKEGNLDFSFEYEEINDKPKKKSADPDYIRFTLVPPLADAIELKMDETEELVIPKPENMYYRSTMEDCRILTKLKEAGNKWAADCLEGKIPYDENYIAKMKSIEESYKVAST